MKILKTALVISSLLLGAAQAQTAVKPGMDSMNMEATQNGSPMRTMDMADMAYQVKDAAMLDVLKAGDKVRFMAEKSGGANVVTAIEQAK